MFAQSSSSQSSSAQSGEAPSPEYARVKTPTLIDPAGPTISLISAEPVFAMATALNECGYDQGLDSSDPLRKRVRDEVNLALAKSEEARAKRDALCLYIAQHNLTGSERDVSQYISLSLYLTPPPELEATADLTEMPPDATQVYEILPILRSFIQAVDLHGIWLTTHRFYDEQVDTLHDSLSQMIVNTNLYLKIPASSYDGRRFVVVVEPMLSPSTVNARVYGTDYVVVVSPSQGKIKMTDVRHTYLHYVIDPLLYSRSNAIDRENPIMKEVRDAPMDFRFRSDPVTLTIECLIKAIEARTMDTGIPAYKIPAGVDRSELPRYQYERQAVEQKMEGVRQAAVHHALTQGFVLTQYFYNSLISFEKDPAGLNDTIGEMVYSMDVQAEAHLARSIQFDKEADEDVLQRNKPRQLTGLDLAEAKLSEGDSKEAASMAQQVLAKPGDAAQSGSDAGRAHFILARVNLATGHPEQAFEDFQETIATSKEQRVLAWSHIYMARMLDLQCKREEAVAEYNQALAVRDGRQDTRLAAERGVKTAYAIPGHEGCTEASASDDAEGEPYPIEADGSTEPKAAQPSQIQPKAAQPKAAAPAKTGAKKP
jgi:tetratricopeptide (TPR) repeat protein